MTDEAEFQVRIVAAERASESSLTPAILVLREEALLTLEIERGVLGHVVLLSHVRSLDEESARFCVFVRSC